MAEDTAPTLTPKHFRSLHLFLLLSLLVGFACSNPEAPAPEAPILVETPSHPPFAEGLLIEHPLQSGTVHEFEILLQPGDALRLVVHQVELDVVSTLFGTGGQEVAWMDSDSGPAGPERLATVSDTGGIYRLKIEPKDHTGSYRLAVARLGRTTAEDIAWARVSEIWRAYRKQGEDLGLDDALMLIEEGLEATTRIGSPLMQARFLRERGNVLRRLSRLDEAIKDLEQAVVLQELHGKAWELASLLNHRRMLTRKTKIWSVPRVLPSGLWRW